MNAEPTPPRLLITAHARKRAVRRFHVGEEEVEAFLSGALAKARLVGTSSGSTTRWRVELDAKTDDEMEIVTRPEGDALLVVTCYHRHSHARAARQRRRLAWKERKREEPEHDGIYRISRPCRRAKRRGKEKTYWTGVL